VPEAEVEIESVRLSFGRRPVFTELSCRLPAGRVSVVLGGSGSGKSTLLRLVAGLVFPDAGRVLVAGENVAELDEAGLARVRRRIGMLFQNGALLDSLNVFENVALPLREHTRLSDDEIEDAVRFRLQAVGLEEVEELLPGELSGGMRRRVALARAIVMDPQIVLCDEPFSGLDPQNVERIEALLLHLNRRLGLTLVVTSHHPASTLRLADQLVLLRDGVAFCADREQVLAAPEHPIGAFLGLRRPEGEAANAAGAP
jgi:phospholipid/cholesterol/gamma-HCH transport system ATP-binding protein